MGCQSLCPCIPREILPLRHGLLEYTDLLLEGTTPPGLDVALLQHLLATEHCGSSARTRQVCDLSQ